MTELIDPNLAESPADCLAQAQGALDQALARAAADEWDEVAALDARCRAAVEWLSQHLDTAELAVLLPDLQQLYEQHRHLLVLAEARRQHLVDARRQSIHARQSVKIYES